MYSLASVCSELVRCGDQPAGGLRQVSQRRVNSWADLDFDPFGDRF